MSEIEQPGSTEFVIHHIVKHFARYSHTLLPATTYIPFIYDINEIFDFMVVEMDFRETSPTTVESYMTIRRVTISISPFFTLLEGSLSMVSTSSSLARLKQLLQEVCGLQNDLIGLDKDIQADWPLNVVMILRELKLKQLLVRGMDDERVQTMTSSVMDARDMHNMAVEEFVTLWRATRGSIVEGEKRISDIMMMFMNRHFMWAVASKRYK